MPHVETNFSFNQEIHEKDDIREWVGDGEGMLSVPVETGLATPRAILCREPSLYRSPEEFSSPGQ